MNPDRGGLIGFHCSVLCLRIRDNSQFVKKSRSLFAYSSVMVLVLALFLFHVLLQHCNCERIRMHSFPSRFVLTCQLKCWSSSWGEALLQADQTAQSVLLSIPVKAIVDHLM